MTTSTLTAGNWQGNLKMGLAPRELEATLWAAADMTVKQIGRAMGISPATAEKRLESARFKLGVKTMRGLVMEAFKRQIIAPLVVLLCMVMVAQQANTEQFGRIRRPSERRAEVRLTVRRAEACAIA
ncbi:MULTISPECIES: LuxR C-terminal-related transcriptional regulator [unclassified Pseudomonas]|jgi:DNA-binding CsgD family transcriptional regulator|uniref:LuxR C-terminal-related transcriptional regulator n=1 Tax=unclassified Pseudomonas TaxID=196821 RepID=UPI00215BD558|nr:MULTISPECIES: LuxR C-terminal-related transcriptional regulator [unclassified Pseudomonas]MCR8932825.1 LuxR C-terminal-related transcriptional regulator [Pseudomonas sp. S11A4]MCR8976427.1 LuxR C-terminal-related transcriptional regulator [Pseudomonas sp. S11P7]